MLRWLRSLFAWCTVWDTGVWCYQENSVTRRRRVLRSQQEGYQPIDRRWLDWRP